MRSVARWLVVAALAGCAAGGPDPAQAPLEECEASVIASFEQVVVTAEPPLGSAAVTPQPRAAVIAPAPVEVAPGEDLAVCNCPDYACVTDWVEQNLGCNLCAHVACSFGSVGGCASCAAVERAPGCALPGGDLPLGD